jgi:hypothetical protein
VTHLRQIRGYQPRSVLEGQILPVRWSSGVSMAFHSSCEKPRDRRM